MSSLTFNWRNKDIIYCSPEKMNEMIDFVHEEEINGNLKETDFYNARSILRIYKTYCLNVTSKGVMLRIFYNRDNFKQYSFNEHIAKYDDINPSLLTGQEAYDYIDELFQSIYSKTKKSLFTAFSSLKFKEVYRKIKLCVPKPISMLNKYATKTIIKNVFKADVSSAYPFEATKPLPTLYGHKIESGRAMPNEEYPFAFYVKSHHVAIYNELDTHYWKEKKKFYVLYDKMFDDSITDEEEETILCKKGLSLKPIFEKLYQKKLEGDPVAKLGMNACIGMFHRDSNPRLSHLASVILARCCNRMIDKCLELEKRKNIVLFIATDSIIWKGIENDCATNSKFLGSFTYEYKDIEFYATGPKAYQLRLADGSVITKYSGMKNGEEKDKLEFGKIPDKKQSKEYVIDSSGHIDEIPF